MIYPPELHLIRIQACHYFVLVIIIIIIIILIIITFVVRYPDQGFVEEHLISGLFH